MDLSNSPVPSYYISDTQFSRLFALAYLDAALREHATAGADYASFAAARIKEVKTASRAAIEEDLAALLGGQQQLAAFKNSVPDAAMYFDRYADNIAHLNPEQSFKDALEENQLWASTNSIVYILITQQFDQQQRQRHPRGAGLFKRSVFDREHQAASGQKILLNMMFINTIRIDPVPSVLEGYSFNLLQDIIHDKDNRAITLPSNATCC